MSTQPLILPRSINWVPGTPGNWMIKSKLSPCSGFVALIQLNHMYKKGPQSFFKYNKIKLRSSHLKLSYFVLKAIWKSWLKSLKKSYERNILLSRQRCRMKAKKKITIRILLKLFPLFLQCYYFENMAGKPKQLRVI